MSRRPPYLMPFSVISEHDLTNQLPRFESEREAAQRSRDLLAMLKRRKVKGLRLEDCYPDEPCNSAACPVCMRKFRRWVAASAANALNQGSRLIRASLIDHSDAVPPDTLNEFDLRTAKRRLSQRIKRTGLANCLVLGGFDFSFNIHSAGSWEPHWQPHAYLIFQAATAEAVKLAMRAGFSKAETVPCPINTQTIENFFEVVSYSVKSEFYQRVTYIDPTGRQNSRQVSLPPERLAELTSYLDDFNPMDRLFQRNINRAKLKPTKKPNSSVTARKPINRG